MIPRPIETISNQDLEALVRNNVPEGRNLEFKRELPGRAEADVKEFLADVTSLANAHGGDIIYGIEESGGSAAALSGIVLVDPDADLLRLENIIRDGIEPRISGLKMRWIKLTNNSKGVIVIRAPTSMAAPHRIRYRNWGRFYTRNSRGKYEMDTQELRLAFTASEQLPIRIRALHDEAVAAAQGTNMPFAVNAEPTAIVSVVPLGFFRELQDLDITPENALMHVNATSATDWMHTLEGVLLYAPITADNTVRSYALTHRRGRVDAAWTIGGEREFGQRVTRRLVWPRNFESGLLDVTRSTVAKLQPFGIEGPWVVLSTITGIEGFELVLGDHEVSKPAWRHAAALPEIVADRLDGVSLAPILKSFWLLFGQVRSDRK